MREQPGGAGCQDERRWRLAASIRHQLPGSRGDGVLRGHARGAGTPTLTLWWELSYGDRQLLARGTANPKYNSGDPAGPLLLSHILGSTLCSDESHPPSASARGLPLPLSRPRLRTRILFARRQPAAGSRRARQTAPRTPRRQIYPREAARCRRGHWFRRGSTWARVQV